MPDLNATEWGTLLTAIFTAFAALAAWRAVHFQGKSIEAARRPHVSAGFLTVTGPPPEQRIEFVNAGPGLAVGLIYFGVEGIRWYGGTAGKGHLVAGEKVEVVLPQLAPLSPSGNATFVWACRDVENTSYVWTYDGRVERRKFGPKKWPSLNDDFKRLYPRVPYPARAPEA